MYNEHYDLLDYNAWNRRLLNLYWICNIIILIVEIAICVVYFTVGPSAIQTPDVVSIPVYVYRYIFIPSGLTVLFTSICEVLVYWLRQSYTRYQPYVVTFTCVAFCMVLIMVHYSVNVIYITCMLPIIFSLVYNNRRVLLLTFLFSVIVFIVVFVYASFKGSVYMRFDFAEVSTSIAILLIAYMICRLILGRNGEIVSILLKTERAAYETKRAKEYAEALADTRSRFLANMSHEIRTPMNGIIGLTELALNGGNLSEKEEDYLSKIRLSAIGLLDIVNDILDISKIDSGKVKLDLRPFNLSEILTECETLIMHDANQKGLRLYFYNEANITSNIVGDQTRLRQALLNVLSNAVKFTLKGSITLLVKIVENKPQSNSVLIYFEISDTGIGITNELLKEIFEPFTQADDSITRRFGGTGLGLTITKSIIETMGGKIEVSSIPDIGSRFSFTLEFGLADDMYLTKNIDSTDKEYPIFEGDVLLCEDNIISKQVAKENLERFGFKVFVAINGKAAVDIVKERMSKDKPFEIIFMDIHMPVMDGVKATKLIKDMNTETPIIAMTANVMPKDREIYINAGMSQCLYKPFRAKELNDCLLKYLTPVGKFTVSEPKLYTDNNAPIDIVQGLVNNVGNDTLYHKSLKFFVEEQPNTLASIKKAVSELDFQSANRLAHTAKNNANIIGAGRLTEITTVMEESLRRDGSYFANDMLDDYEDELNKVLNYIAKMNIS